MKTTLSLIGVGAFGAFILPHVAPHFDMVVTDTGRDVAELATAHKARQGTLADAAQADIIVIAVPVGNIRAVTAQIAPLLRPGQLVMDVASVKCLPAEIFCALLPPAVDVVGLHPLFGPQSGKNGIAGLNISVVNVRGERDAAVAAFLAERLGLNVIRCTAAEHDEQMAYVQGLTHMIARVFQMMEMPDIHQETHTFSLLRQMVNIVKDDSDALFHAIQTDNPYVGKTKQKFFDAVRQLEERLTEKRP